MTRNNRGIGIYIDKLTNCIESAVTGDIFQTEVNLATMGDLKRCNVHSGWKFNWSNPNLSSPKAKIYKLTIKGNPKIIQGLIALRLESNFIFVELIESAPFNYGRNKQYIGVAGNLIAFACLMSDSTNRGGVVSFHAKTVLVSHYQKTLGATVYGSNLMVIEPPASQILIKKYYKKTGN